MSGFLWGAREEEQPKTWWQSLTDGFSLSYYQRIVGFAVSFVIGIAFCFLVPQYYLLRRWRTLIE